MAKRKYGNASFRNRGSEDNVANFDFKSAFEQLSRMTRLKKRENIINALKAGARVIQKAGRTNLKATPGGNRILQTTKSPTLPMVRTDNDTAYVRVSVTGRDDYRLPWMEGGTKQRQTKGGMRKPDSSMGRTRYRKLKKGEKYNSSEMVYRKPANRGSMPATHFFTKAREQFLPSATEKVKKEFIKLIEKK